MILIKIIVMGLFCYGIYQALKVGFLLYPVKKKLSPLFPVWINKPVFNCIYCMASFWGSIAFILISYKEYDAAEHLVCCVCCIPANWFFYNLFEPADEPTV